MKIYSMFDAKAKFYGRPMFIRNKGDALRSWEAAVNDPKTDVSRFPGDFCLFEIGEFDELTGRIKPHEAFDSLGFGVEFVKPVSGSSLSAV